MIVTKRKSTQQGTKEGKGGDRVDTGMMLGGDRRIRVFRIAKAKSLLGVIRVDTFSKTFLHKRERKWGV
jgi:hypothetical protein